MVVLLIIALRVNKVVTKSMQTVSMVSQYIMLPFTYLASMFSKDETEEKPARRRSVSKKQ